VSVIWKLFPNSKSFSVIINRPPEAPGAGRPVTEKLFAESKGKLYYVSKPYAEWYQRVAATGPQPGQCIYNQPPSPILYDGNTHCATSTLSNRIGSRKVKGCRDHTPLGYSDTYIYIYPVCPPRPGRTRDLRRARDPPALHATVMAYDCTEGKQRVPPLHQTMPFNNTQDLNCMHHLLGDVTFESIEYHAVRGILHHSTNDSFACVQGCPSHLRARVIAASGNHLKL